jgi:glyoxylase-like metal-dependent hydrolase (beta-lactamase superfamily II)
VGWTFGDITVDCVVEQEQPLLLPAVLYPTSTPEGWDAHRSWLDPTLLDPASQRLVMSIHSFVVRTRHHTIVVDTGGGNDKPRPQKPRYHMNRYPYLERLAALGVTPDSVDFVVFTHLHVDHVGWNTRLVDGRWVPTFPRARYLIPRLEWDFWREEYTRPEFTDDPYYEDSILPVLAAGQAVFVDGDHAIEDRVRLEPLPGHTPGHVAVRLAGGGREAVMSGDLMHHPIQCAEPQWNSCFCVDAEQAHATRRAFLERHADTDTLVMTAHFRTPGAGRIVRHGTAWRFAFDDKCVR